MLRTVLIISSFLILSGHSCFSQDETIKIMTKQELLNAGGINIYFPNFDFDTKIKVISYEVSAYTIDGDFTIRVKGTTRFNNEVKELIRRMKRNQRFYIENIKVKLEDGTVRKLSPVTVKIRF